MVLLRTIACLIPVLACAVAVGVGLPVGPSRAAAQNTPVAVAGPVSLTADAVEVLLRSEGPSFAETFEALSGDERIYLVLRDLRIAQQPSVVYQLYLGSSLEQESEAARLPLLGNLNFFGVFPTPGGEEPSEEAMRSFDITGIVQGLVDELGSEATITIEPSGTPAPGSEPVVGAIEITVARFGL